MTFDGYDYTVQTAAFWHRNYQAAKNLKEAFEDGDDGLIPASLIREGEEDFLAFIDNGNLARYLYHVHA